MVITDTLKYPLVGMITSNNEKFLLIKQNTTYEYGLYIEYKNIKLKYFTLTFVGLFI